MAAVVHGVMIRCRTAIRPLITTSSVISFTRVGATKLPALPVNSCTACLRRWQTTTAMGENAGDTKEETWMEKAKKRSWFWRWLNDIDQIEKNTMSDEEYQEREKLIQKMTDLYFDDPKKKWDISLYREIFDLLIKYNDRVGVEIFYGMMKEMQVEADDELIEKVESFRVKAKESSWFD